MFGTSKVKAQVRPGTGLPAGRGHGKKLVGRLFRNPSAVLVANSGLQSILRLASNVVLARLLTPDAFALTSIVMLILTGLQMISDMGISIMALREGVLDEERQARLWTVQFVRGLALMATVCLLSEPIAWLYDTPELGNVLRVLSLMPALQGAQGLYPVLALAQRNLLPSVLTELGGRVCGIVVSIGVALVSPTVWALVAGTLAQFVVSVAVSHVMAGRALPRLVFDREFLKEQWRFSRWIQLSSTFSFLGMQVDKALLPFLFGLPALGLYSIGATFAAIPAQVTQRWSASIFYPLTVQLLRGGEAARDQLRRVRVTMLMYSAVLTLTIVAGAPFFFFLLYKPIYHDAARFAQLMAAGTFLEVAESSLRHFPLVDDTSRFEVLAVLVRLGSFLTLAAIIYLTDAPIAAYAVAYVAGMAASYGFMLIVGTRRGYVRPGADLLVVAPLIAAEVAAYVMPLPKPEPLAMVAGGMLTGLVAAGLLGLVYLRRGLPSLPPVVAPEVLRDVGEHETGERADRD